MESISGKAIWNEASKAGLIFGLISVAYNYISMYLNGLQGASFMINFLSNIGGWILWVAKFVGIILLMRACMKRLTRKYDGVTNGDSFMLGVAISLLSSLIVAGFTLLNVSVLFVEQYQQLLTQVSAEMQPMLDANSRAAMEDIMNRPSLFFWGTLFYCFLFGVILSRILSRRIPAQDPFADFHQSDNLEQQ